MTKEADADMASEWGEPDEQVPAFNTAIGLPPGKGEPATVSKRALARVNAEVKNDHADSMRYHQEVAQVASLFAKRAIQPDEIAALRRSMFDTVKKGLNEVDQVIMGLKTWTPTQTRLFAILTERVMPKLSNITVEDNTAKKLEDLSLDELEAIALGKKKAGAVDAIVREAGVLDEAAEKHERREAKADVTRQLAYIDALDQAEKHYIARQIDKPAAEIEREGVKAGSKRQPKFTDEQLANVRAARHKGPEHYWREKGMTEEQIAERKAEIMERRLATKAKLRAERLTRLAVKQGLDADAEEAAKLLQKTRQKTLREFRVNPLKGVRKPTTLAKQAAARAEQAAEQERRALAPRVYGHIEGVPMEKPTLADVREHRPDLFVPSENGLGTGEGLDELDSSKA